MERGEGERLTSLCDGGERSYHYTHAPRCGRRTQLFCPKGGSPHCCAIYARDGNERWRKEGGIGKSGEVEGRLEQEKAVKERGRTKDESMEERGWGGGGDNERNGRS